MVSFDFATPSTSPFVGKVGFFLVIKGSGFFCGEKMHGIIILEIGNTGISTIFLIRR